MQDTSLFEEALADAKKLREVAEQNAKNAIIEAVTPKIKSMIESQLGISEESGNEDDDDLLLGLNVGSEQGSEDQLSFLQPDAPQEDDPDEFPPESVYNVTEESLNALVSLIHGQTLSILDESAEQMELDISRKYDDISDFRKSANKLIESGRKINYIKYNEMVKQRRNMLLSAYGKLQENKHKFDSSRFVKLERKLEKANLLIYRSLNHKVNSIQEKLEKLSKIVNKVSEKNNKNLSAKTKQGIGKLYSEILDLQLKENVNQKEVLNLKEDILKIYRKIR
jgi:hypothetical protein